MKKLLYCTISMLLLICLVSTFCYTTDNEVKPIEQWSAEEISNNATHVGYKLDNSTDVTSPVYSSVLSISHILLPHNGDDFNTVIVSLKEAISYNDVDGKINTPKLYYNIDDFGRFVDDNYCDATISEDGTTLVFRTYFPEEKNSIALNIDGDFAINYIAVYKSTASDVSIHFNATAFIVLVCIITILLLIEKKLNYFHWIIQKIKHEAELIKSKERRYVIHILAITFTTLLILAVAILITFGVYSLAATMTVFILAIFAIIFQLIDKTSSKGNSSAAKIFLTLTLLLGIMMSYTSPPSTFTAWDDHIHFRFAYIFSSHEDSTQSLSEFKQFSYQDAVNNYVSDPSYFTKTMVYESDIPLNQKFDSVQPYTLISYSPMVVMILLLKLLHVDIVKILVLTRMANLFAWAYITYAGIKKLRYGTYIFSAVCLLPCIIYLGCSYSYDFWLTAWLVYCFAYIISLIQQPDRKITPLDGAKILLAFFIGCSAKALYCVLMLPLLFINKDKFAKPSYAKVFRVFTVLTFLVIITIIVLSGIFSPNFYADSRGGDDIDVMRQFVYVVTHPFEFARTLFIHIEEFCSLKRFNIYSATFGYLDGYEGSKQLLYGTVAMFILIFCIFTDRCDNDNYECALMQKTRWITLATCFLTVVVICGSMYAAYNDVGATTINGTQFRYLFPLFAPFFYFLKPKKIYCDISESKKSALIFGGLSANILVGYFTTYLWKLWI